MYKLFRWPQDVVWIVIGALCLIGIIFSVIALNLVASLISSATLLGFALVWFLIIFRPWYKIEHSCRLVHKGIRVCYHAPFEKQEIAQVKMCINNIQEKLEMKQWLSRVCIIDRAFAGTIVFLADDINEKYFKERYGMNYKKIAGIASGKIALVDISGGIPSSALRHELGHIILDSCHAARSEAEHHLILSGVGV